MTDRYPAFSEVTEDGEVEVRIEDREGSPSKHGSILGPFPNDEEAARVARLNGATSYDRRLFLRRKGH